MGRVPPKAPRLLRAVALTVAAALTACGVDPAGAPVSAGPDAAMDAAGIGPAQDTGGDAGGDAGGQRSPDAGRGPGLALDASLPSGETDAPQWAPRDASPQDTAPWPPDALEDTSPWPPDVAEDASPWPPEVTHDAALWPPDAAEDAAPWPPDADSPPTAPVLDLAGPLDLLSTAECLVVTPAVDPDGDAVELLWSWSLDGATVPAATESTVKVKTLEPPDGSPLTAGMALRCAAVPLAGGLLGPAGESPPVLLDGADVCGAKPPPCDPLAKCKDVGTLVAKCTCPSGTTGDGTTCKDVNECAKNNGGCGLPNTYTCKNKVAADPVCTLQKGYHLPWKCGQKKTCTAGNGQFHHGGDSYWAFDFSMAKGTPVLAMRGGKVTAVQNASKPGSACYNGCPDPKTFESCCKACITKANWVNVRHFDGTIGHYAHLSTVAVKVGQVVDQGKKLGEAGTTGCSTGSHLHTGVMKGCPTGICKMVKFTFAEAGSPKGGTSVTSKNCPE